MKETDVEGLAFYHHWWIDVQTRVRSKFVRMFAWWWDFDNPTRDAQRSWWQTFFDERHSPKGVKCLVLVANSTQGCTPTLSILWCLLANWKFLTYPNGEVDHMLLAQPFMKWGLDFIGPTKLVSHSHGNKHILNEWQVLT
jgi:hypothetical protein